MTLGKKTSWQWVAITAALIGGVAQADGRGRGDDRGWRDRSHDNDRYPGHHDHGWHRGHRPHLHRYYRPQ